MAHKKSKLDKIAHGASLACAIHCATTPLLVIAAPFFGHLFDNPFIEFGLLSFSLISGIFIIARGYQHHHQRQTILLFSIGAMMWIIHAIGHIHILSEALFLFGTIFVLTSYYVNHKHLHICKCHCHH